MKIKELWCTRKSKKNPHKVNETTVKMTNITEDIHIKKHSFPTCSNLFSFPITRPAKNPFFEAISPHGPTGPLHYQFFLEGFYPNDTEASFKILAILIGGSLPIVIVNFNHSLNSLIYSLDNCFS